MVLPNYPLWRSPGFVYMFCIILSFFRSMYWHYICRRMAGDDGWIWPDSSRQFSYIYIYIIYMTLPRTYENSLLLLIEFATFGVAVRVKISLLIFIFFTTTGIADVIIMWLTHAPAGGTIGSFQDGVHKIHNSISAGAVHGTARLYRSFYLFTLHAGNGRMSKKEAKKEWNMKVEEDGWFILDTRKDNNEDQLRFII